MSAIDRTLAGGLRAGAVHDWIGIVGVEERRWSPPLCLLSHLAACALDASPHGWVVWVGRRVWPYPRVLVHHRGASTPGALLDRSIFVRTSDPSRTLWAADVAMRCHAITCVVADGSGFDIAASRRLQLAAQGGRSIGLLARPPTELNKLSCARTRWLVGHHERDTHHGELGGGKSGSALNPRWTVELLRCKGVQPAPEAPRRWVVELSSETGDISVDAGVVRGPDQASRRAPQRITA